MGEATLTTVSREAIVERPRPLCVLGSQEGYSTRVYPKLSGLAAWSENCKWYSSLPLDAVV